ncbi:TFIIB-type zinc ribbon-containing protein [Demequina sediminicola]|uniref:TFIIB-type zinc ribbon-containing protein n=1 Tax=Demequina sediminicola TaxID=1095026 RepID=UPI000A512B96|nr:TFIIB-type zinc ribbon-containing protein [Demequina sediminicola]
MTEQLPNSDSAPAVGDAWTGRVTKLDTTTGAEHGRDSCPKCGSTEISHKAGTMSLVCAFCRHEWTGQRLEDTHGLGEGISSLSGRTVTSGASAMDSDKNLITMKCQGCGAEVTVDTAHATQSRCHWCRSILSINDKLPNGAIPDGILPFSLSKTEAMERITKFVSDRKMLANPKFKADFSAEQVRQVYLPYMVVDGNLHTRIHGVGEVQTRRYTVQHGKTSTTYYDANEYQVVRQFDLHADDLIVESSASKADFATQVSTNNIINAILPFDVKNMVAFDSNYMGEIQSEKRDMDINDVANTAYTRFLTLARERIRPDFANYDRGVRITHEEMWVRGSRWATVYLPVWLYSYPERDDDGRLTVHYVAVNGRSGSTMGSVPISKSRLWGATLGFAAGTALIAWPIAFATLLA